MPDFCKLVKNSDQQYECRGCKLIEGLFRKRREDERRKPRFSDRLTIKFHANFQELAGCAEKGCVTCQVLERALSLRQITRQEADELRTASAQDLVWASLPSTQGTDKNDLLVGKFLEVGVGKKKTAVVSYSDSERNEMGFANLGTDPMGKTVLDEARKWLRDCHEGHTICKNLRWSEKDNPSYLVYIKPGCKELQLQKTSEEKELLRYAALSYSWGNETTTDPRLQKLIKATKTTQDNIMTRENSFLVSELPKTIRDAIRLTWSLDIPYIWVDAMCIPPGIDWDIEASKMHIVYGNAHVTLAACSSIRSTDGLFRPRQAWQYQSKAYRLSHKYWLANLDMPLKEIRLRTPLFKRAWTLQEERLSPRILYLCGQRMYWSCVCSQQTEMGWSERSRPFEGPDTLEWLWQPQKFLETRREQNEHDLHEQWLELVKAYTRRSMYTCGDRLPAMSGLAAQYISTYADGEIVTGEEYFAGLWRRTFAQDLAWSVQYAKDPSNSLYYVAPTWSWASVPLCSDVTTQHKIKPIGDRLSLLEPSQLGKNDQSDKVLDVVKRGALVKSVKVSGPVRRFIKEHSVTKAWDAVRVKKSRGGDDEYDFSSFGSQYVHSRNSETGQIVAHEPRKREIAGQLDYLFPEKSNPGPWLFITDDALTGLYCLQIGTSTMLLLEKVRRAVEVEVDEKKGEPIWLYRRAGICNSVQQLFFASAVPETLILI